MYYEITTVKNTAESTDYIIVNTVTVKIYSGDDNTSTLFKTGISYVVGDETTAINYAKFIMLPDLKINNPVELADLVLPTEDSTS